MREQLSTKFYTSASVARRLGVVPDRVRQLARSGKLQAAIVTSRGDRLFTEEEVARYERLRQSA
jgi:DNA-binding transcriptional MerR regulator